jgi:tellurite resistance protein TerC
LLVWILFLALVLVLLALDLGVFHRRAHAIALPEALRWSIVWTVVALAFGVVVYFLYDRHWFGRGLAAPEALTGAQAATQYLVGYVVERSLSLDNLFVIAMIFRFFRLPSALEHRALYWGILGALVLRGAMIAMGVALIQRFEWMTYVFGAILLWTALRLLRHGDEDPELEHNPVLKLARRYLRITPDYRGTHFFVRQDGLLWATPMVPLLLLVETSDVVFAVDSIPAVFGVTRDPFLVFTSNIFAILGLRALFFLLSGFMDRFRYLKPSIVLILAYVGAKMLLAEFVHISALASLGVITVIMAAGVIASWRAGDGPGAPPAPGGTP